MRQETVGADPPTFTEATADCALLEFHPLSYSDVSYFLRRLPDKISQSDPMPVSLRKVTSDLLTPFLAELFNRSLSSGSFPKSWKRARISPMLKKGEMEPQSLASYRPISKLPALAKLLEKIVASQVQCYIYDHNLLPSLQSAYAPTSPVNLQY